MVFQHSLEIRHFWESGSQIPRFSRPKVQVAKLYGFYRFLRDNNSKERMFFSGDELVRILTTKKSDFFLHGLFKKRVGLATAPCIFDNVGRLTLIIPN